VGTKGSDSKKEGVDPRPEAEPKSGDAMVRSNPKMLDMSLLPPSAMELLQKLLATMADKGKAPEGEQETKIGNPGTEARVDVPESSAQGEARSTTDFGKPPYCYRCLSRGHQKEDCVAQIVCEICGSSTHVKARCPLHKKAVKSFAMTCGYAVDGLGFYFIHHPAVLRNKEGSKLAVIKVIQGNLSAAQVQAEMERLVSGKGKWVVEEIDSNTFKATFLSKSKLQKMIEWGAVQSKDHKAVMIIEEGAGGRFFKQALNRVWVQMTGLTQQFGQLEQFLG
jgi:hypothetical protein